MRKNGYKFNSETLLFDKIEHGFRRKSWSWFKKSFSSLSLAIVIFFCISLVLESPNEKSLKREKEEILAQYTLLSNQLEKMDAVLKNLEKRDDNLYRVIFEAEPIDASIRRAGTGGVNKYEHLKDFNDANLIISTSKKLDELSKALYIQSKSFDEVEKLTRNKFEMLASIPAIMPVSKNDKIWLASGFGVRMHPLYKRKLLHAGMDFAGPIGTPIYATGNGVVESTGFDKGYGKHIRINHGFNYVTLYAHMNEFKVKKGQKVKRGDIIGYIGNTGSSTGAHLHYEVRKNGRPVNPINYYFNDLTPDEYDNLILEANNSGQTLD